MILSEIVNENKKQPKRANIAKSLVEQAKYIATQNIEKWRGATDLALSVHNPNYDYLIDVYNDVMLDGHLTGIVDSIKNEIKAKEYHIVDSNGEVDEDKTKLFERKWYFQTLDLIVDAVMYGYTLVQFGDIKDGIFTNAQAITRNNIVPPKRVVKKMATDSVNSTAIPFLEPPWSLWNIWVSDIPEQDVDKTYLGLLHKAAPHALAKKELLQCAWEYAEKFGMPITVGSTSLQDSDRRANMENSLQNMGRRQWIVVDGELEDKIEFTESSRQDAYQIFMEPLRESNNELSKLILNQTGTTDEKSFVGSSEVHERTKNNTIKTYLRLVNFVMNDQVIPLLNVHNLGFEGLEFKWQAEEDVNQMEKISIVKDLNVNYNIPADFVQEYTGIPVEDKEEETEPKEKEVQSIMPAVGKMYKDLM